MQSPRPGSFKRTLVRNLSLHRYERNSGTSSLRLRTATWVKALFDPKRQTNRIALCYLELHSASSGRRGQDVFQEFRAYAVSLVVGEDIEAQYRQDFFVARTFGSGDTNNGVRIWASNEKQGSWIGNLPAQDIGAVPFGGNGIEGIR
jgi:hypothetical protein